MNRAFEEKNADVRGRGIEAMAVNAVWVSWGRRRGNVVLVSCRMRRREEWERQGFLKKKKYVMT